MAARVLLVRDVSPGPFERPADRIGEAYDQLSALAPTLAYDMSGTSWQDATTEIAAALGLEDNAAAAIDTYDDLVADVAELFGDATRS